MKILFILIILLLSLGSIAQKKNKKGAYDDYWKQQEQLEIFETKSKTAHKQFQEGKLKLALTSYEEALKLKPEDQKTIAKIRDIKILMKKNEDGKLSEQKPDTLFEEKIPKQEIIVTDTIIKTQETDMDTVQNKISEPNAIKTNSEKETIPFTTKKAQTVSNKPAPSKKAETEKSLKKAYKNTENYRKYLATIFKEGWTEEKYDEGNKKVVKRVHVYGDHGDEYLKVTHHYGAVFYFKNGLSISYGTWVGQTKEMDKKE